MKALRGCPESNSSGTTFRRPAYKWNAIAWQLGSMTATWRPEVGLPTRSWKENVYWLGTDSFTKERGSCSDLP